MLRDFPDFPVCIYDASLQPRTIRGTVRQNRSFDPSTMTSREERAVHALDIFDRTIKRTEHLLAHLRYHGYDITTVADELRQLQNMRGDLTRAFKTPGQDLRHHLQNIFEIRVVGLCSAISSLKNDDPVCPDRRYPEYITGNNTVFSVMSGDYLSRKCDGA